MELLVAPLFAESIEELLLTGGLNGGEVSGVAQELEVFAAVDGGGAGLVGAALVGLEEGLGEFVHHHAAVFAIGDLGDEGGHADRSQGEPIAVDRLVVGLHLADQLGVGALGLDQGGDLAALTPSIAGDEAIWDVLLGLAQGFAAEGLDAVFLEQKPAVAGLLQGLHQGKEGVGVIGQGHLRQGETAHPLQGLQAEGRGELVLPGLDLQPKIRDRRRGGDGVAPEGAEPLDVPLHLGITGQVMPGLGDVAAAHLLGPPEQIAGDVEHDPRAAALLDELGDQIGQAPVALREGLGVVVIPLVGVLQHVLEVGDQRSIGARRDRRLMHVQRAGKPRAQLIELQRRLPRPVGAAGGHGGADLGFAAAEVGPDGCAHGDVRTIGPSCCVPVDFPRLHREEAK